MNIIEKIFALKRSDVFSELSDLDIARIADSLLERAYEPDELFCSAGKKLSRMYIVIEGSFQTRTDRRTPSVFGPASLLLDMQVGEDIIASPVGAICLILERGIFFTIIYQHPSIILNMLAEPQLETLNKQEETVSA